MAVQPHVAELFSVIVFVSAPACSSTSQEREDKQEECAALAEEVRAAARERAIESEGLCNAEKVPELVASCARLAECNRELAELR